MINLTQTGLALAEGFGLALSPCILPILPLILATSATGGRSRPVQIVLGFIASFTVFSLIARQILAATGLPQDRIQMGAFVFLLLFGLVMLIPRLEEKFAALTGGLAGRANDLSNRGWASRAGGGLVVGALIGLVWTPCAGPILAVALLQVIQSHTDLDAVLTIAAFSVGAGIPMLLIGLTGQSLVKHIRALARHAVAIRRAMGIVVVIFSTMGLVGFNLGEWVVTARAAPAESRAMSATLQDGVAAPYAAPEIDGIAHWINGGPTTLGSLKGKVVLIDFWTYSCINCIRTLPHITSWYEKYKDKGLVVIGVHAPEFAFEGEIPNVEKAVRKFGITYPVAMDNDFVTWRAYHNHYWPAHYLIDREGHVVYTHFGEGHYDITEGNIRVLLGLTDDAKLDKGPSVTSDNQTPETYLGTARAERMEADANALPLHHWALNGAWAKTGAFIEAKGKDATLTLRYHAKKVFLVMESADGAPKTVHVTQNGATHDVTVQDSTLYTLTQNPNAVDATVTLTADAPGVRMFAFTFES